MIRQPRFAVFTLASLLLVGVCHYYSASAARHLTQTGQQVIIYTGPGYTGRSQILYESWPGGGYFDGRVRSIRVPPGTRVTLYSEANYRGRQTDWITEDMSPPPGAWWAGRVRSIRVEREATTLPQPPVTASYPVIYAQSGYRGSSQAVERDWAAAPIGRVRRIAFAQSRFRKGGD